MSNLLDTLVEMGFSHARAKLAIERTGGNDIQTAMDWILSNDEEPSDNVTNEPKEPSEEAAEGETSTAEGELSAAMPAEDNSQVAKSIRCEDCGKLFKSQVEVEFHAAKSGHENYSESTEEKKPLTDEEKKEQLARIEAKLKQRRLEREAREKQDELEKEKYRIKSGKEMLEAKKKQEEMEMKKIIEQRKREKEEERLARQRVRDQIEQDKLARKAKFGGEQPKVVAVETAPTVQKVSNSQNYTDVKLQIRLTNGQTLTETFKATEPLSAVRLYVELNRTDGNEPFNLMTPFPKKIFEMEDFEKPLSLLGLAPSAVIIVTKSRY